METTKLVKKLDTYKIHIPIDVENKIRHICSKIYNIEWSGILFYTYTGTFENNDLEITCKDIYVMDIGSSAYTEFNMSPDVASYIVENPELMDCQQSLIHSHHSMKAFFSGTDLNTLQEEGDVRNNFVSLIVNNAGEYVAAVTRKVTSIKNINDCYSYEFFGEGNKENCKEYLQKEEVIEYFMLDIIKEGIVTYEDIDSRLEEIKNSKKTNDLLNVKPIYYNNMNTNISEGNLFKDEEEFYFNKNNYTLNSSLRNSQANPNIVKSLLAQIISGCVVVNDLKFDMEKWVNNMESLYDKRFKENMAMFDIWADSLCEFLIWYIEDDNLSNTGMLDEAISALYASVLIEELQLLPQNKYITGYIKSLNKYTDYYE